MKNFKKEELIQKIWESNIDQKNITRIIESYKSKIEMTNNGAISQKDYCIDWEFPIQLLKTSMNKKVDEDLICSALASYDKEKSDILLAFTKRLNELIIEHKKKQKEQCKDSSMYIFPTNICMEDGHIRNVKVFKYPIYLVNNKYVKKMKNNDSFVSPQTKNKFYNYNGNYLVVKKCSSFIKAYSILDYFYSCVDLITLWNSFSIEDYLKTGLLLPEWCLENYDNNQNLISLHANNYISANKKYINQATYLSIEKLLRITNFDLSTNDSRIEILIVNMILFFAEALRSQNSSIQFHDFWLILEAIAKLSNVNLKQEKIINRLDVIIRLFENKNMNYKNLLNYWKKKRNRIAHDGFDDISYGDMNAIKRIAAKSIFWLYRNRKDFPTINHLEEFYNSKNMNKDKLKIRKEITQRLLKNEL